MATIKDWIEAARPKTLGAAIAPVFIGTTIGAHFGGQWHPWLAVCTLTSCMALQIATNWFNDALDFVKGGDTAARIGPRRITASGVVTSRQVMTAAVVMLLIAALLSIPLIQARGWPIIAIGIPSLYFCYGYTGGPAPLAYRGLGELFVILFFGLIAVTGSAFVQSGQWHLPGLIAGIQTGCLSTMLIAINNMRDIAEDRTTGKRTLAARFGLTFARWELTALIAVTAALQCYWWSLGFERVVWRSWPWMLVEFFVVHRAWTTPPGPFYNRLLMLAGMALLLYSVLTSEAIDHFFTLSSSL